MSADTGEAAGGCLCGSVRYRVRTSGARTVVCHCRNCQRQSGSAFSIMLVVPKQHLQLSGELSTYSDRGDSGNIVMRRFCPHCGTALVSEPTALPEIAALKAGTLDDISMLSPQVHLWSASAQPWVKLPDDIPCLAGQPRG